MKAKKNAKSDLEKKRVIFFEIGLVVSLAILLLAFETGNSVMETANYTAMTDTDFMAEEIIPITRPEVEVMKPPLPPIEFDIVNDAEIDISEPEYIWDIEGSESDIIIPTVWETAPEDIETIPIYFAEQMPIYRGGTQAEFQKHVQQIVEYPEQAIELGIQGRVFLDFVVDQNGKISNPTIVRSPDDLLSNAVLAALKKTDKWQPGEQLKRKVSVRFTIPIIFVLQ